MTERPRKGSDPFTRQDLIRAFISGRAGIEPRSHRATSVNRASIRICFSAFSVFLRPHGELGPVPSNSAQAVLNVITSISPTPIITGMIESPPTFPDMQTTVADLAAIAARGLVGCVRERGLVPLARRGHKITGPMDARFADPPAALHPDARGSDHAGKAVRRRQLPYQPSHRIADIVVRGAHVLDRLLAARTNLATQGEELLKHARHVKQLHAGTGKDRDRMQ